MAATQTAREALAADLRDAIAGEVRFTTGDRALYSTDASNYRQLPIGVVLPAHVDDVVRAIEIARRHHAPVLARGGGTSLAGQTCNTAVVLDISRHLTRILSIDPDGRRARVEPGVVLDDLRDAAERYHLTFAPDPSTHDRCTIGGMIGNNSCGVHSVMAGKTDDNIDELEIVTYDGHRLHVGETPQSELESIIAAGGRRGEIYGKLRDLRDRYADAIRREFPDIPRRVSGYNLPYLLPENGFHVARALVGSEGTCVTVLAATVCLVHSPPARSLLVLGYPDVATAADQVPLILEHGPIGLEGFDDRMIGDMRRRGLDSADVRLLPAGRGWLLVEFGAADRRESDDLARDLMEALKSGEHPPSVKLVDDPNEARRIWAVREAGLGASAFVPGQGMAWPGWEDSAVPPDRFGNYLRDLRSLMDRFSYDGAFYGHFGQGCLHTRIDFDLVTTEGIKKFNGFLEQAAELVVSYGGSLSGEHGDGQARASLLPKMFGPEIMQAFREFKAIWDPENRMNPGKVVDPYRPDQNLRLGTDYQPANPRTHFAFPEDGFSMPGAILRCVGVGKCRRHDGGTMCPSYMVTREEQHSTRGRAHLLFEMFNGTIPEGWRNDAVRDALDLCLACKGCKGDCPVNVDMATYKAEFYAHYFAHRLRPVTAYSMGLIHWWARLAAHAPRLVNLVTHLPGLAALIKYLGGIAPQRTVPTFARATFKEWWSSRTELRPGRIDAREPAPGHRVLLWPDTFNNHFHPEVGRAAVRVLEAAGFEVDVPGQSLCCGRPLYDFGFLTQAKSLLRQILKVLRDDLRAGVPIVVLEPSCASVFRDELTNLLPHDEDAHRLGAQTFLLSEFLERYAPDWQPKQIRGRALVHGHCHHKALMGMSAEEAVLRRLGLDFSIPDDGCCGMAGAFGFEREHYDVSIACAERVLLPAVRAEPEDTLLVTDGFSCREQIAQTTGRHALHLAEVLEKSLDA